jgi:acyl-CoA synthetase (NDP forming)/GNAT superfamily N-acetyltransferase
MATTAGPDPAAFPAHQDVDVVLRDGSTVHVRPVRPDDRPALERFLAGLSDESRLLRFFSFVKDVSAAAGRFSDVDYRDRHGLIALHGPDQEIVGHGFYAVERPGRAEVALAVADAMQGRGLGTLLLGQLAQAAAEAGIGLFTAEVMPQNHRMLTVFRDSGFPIRTASSCGAVHVELPTELGPDALERFEERAGIAATAALRRFLRPRAVAVIGASNRQGSIGHQVFRNLLASGFPGPVYPVSPHPAVQSVAAVDDVRKLPGPVDLAVVVVPADRVVETARGCAEHGVRALVVISAGFAETGPEGRRRQADLLEVCRASGMRLIGPNCMGILNTDPEHRLDVTFAPAFPPAGRIGFLSQSGALGLAVIEHASRLGLGLSSFVSVGNKADISGNDLLEYWEADEATGLVLLYLESFGNPRRFARIARRLGRRKPVLAVKGGRTAAGARATSSHTGALLAASDVTVDALFAQSGVIRADTLGELFDVAALLSSQPAPAGRRVGIVTNAGGLGILCADACVEAGLEVPEPSAGLRAAVAALLPAAASPGNPVDMIAGATPEQYEEVMRAVGGSGEVDALVAIHIRPIAAPTEPFQAAIARAAAALAGRLPVVAVLRAPATAAGERSVPTYAFPEEAARALARAASWAEWRSRPEEPPWPAPDARPDEARAVIAEALGRGETWLSPASLEALLRCYGIPLVESRLAATAVQAGAAAAAMGGPVALKAVGPDVVHKTELGAVALGLRGAARVAAAARRMEARLAEAGAACGGFLVQRMAPAGVEMIVGVVQDPVFGPVVACGAGGATVELLHDVSVRLTPLSEAEADRMIRGLATFPLLNGYRGAPPLDSGALRQVLLRVAALVEDLPEVAELDLNPVLVGRRGATVVDARVRVEARPPRAPEATRPHPARG